MADMLNQLPGVKSRISNLQSQVSALQTQSGQAGLFVWETDENGDLMPPRKIPNRRIASHVMGMVLTNEGGGSGTWVRINENYEVVPFDINHGTWVGIKNITTDRGSFVEIPITYVKTETIASGTYSGKNCWWVADGYADGFHIHPAFIGSDGQPHNLQIAAYLTSKDNGDLPYSDDVENNSDYWSEIMYSDVRSTALTANTITEGGYRAYNIYDHHFLARMMLTEFGTPNVQSLTINNVAWTGANRINYHGIYDLFGKPNYDLYYWIDGLSTLEGTYQVLAATGSGQIVETDIDCINACVWPINCRTNKVNNIDFGDLFIASASNATENNGSFSDYQYLNSGKAFVAAWGTDSNQGAFCLLDSIPTTSAPTIGWRLSRCY